MRESVGSGPVDAGAPGCAWDRLASRLEKNGDAKDHGEAEEGVLRGQRPSLAKALRAVPTQKLRWAAINAAALRVRAGLGAPPEASAARMRDAPRADALSAIVEMSRGDDDCEIMAIALEHAAA
jgi:hypothetical protein